MLICTISQKTRKHTKEFFFDRSTSPGPSPLHSILSVPNAMRCDVQDAKKYRNMQQKDNEREKREEGEKQIRKKSPMRYDGDGSDDPKERPCSSPTMQVYTTGRVYTMHNEPMLLKLMAHTLLGYGPDAAQRGPGSMIAKEKEGKEQKRTERKRKTDEMKQRR